MKYTDIIQQYIGKGGDIGVGEDGGVTFFTGFDRSNKKSRILEVGDDFVLVKQVDDRVFGNHDEDIYVPISNFSISIRR